MMYSFSLSSLHCKRKWSLYHLELKFGSLISMIILPPSILSFGEALFPGTKSKAFLFRRPFISVFTSSRLESG